jgi:AAA+ ATPase superfamily predicted ATPase
MKRALGNWVVGESFWDREKELGLLIEYLEHGANILLTAPRRTGKTSLMREAARNLEGKYICLQVDLQKANSAADAVVELSMATRPHLNLWKKTTSLFSSVLEKMTGTVESLRLDQLTVTLRSDVSIADWQAKGDRLFEALSESELPVIIFFDEVPILVNRLLQGADYHVTAERRKETDAFMSWLRENSIRYQGRVRIVVTGSIGLEPILHLAGLNATLNTFTPFPLGPWSGEVARGFLREAASEYGVNLKDNADLTVIEQLGYCIPHYVQVFFDKLYRHCRLSGTTDITPVLVEEIYKTDMLGVQGHAELSHLEERLRTVLGPVVFPLALEALTEAAVAGTLSVGTARAITEKYPVEGKSPDDVLREILGILEHDGYLEMTPAKEYRFVSKLVQDWWRARFAFTYRPLVQAAKEESR